jgi:hypothetical protein
LPPRTKIGDAFVVRCAHPVDTRTSGDLSALLLFAQPTIIYRERPCLDENLLRTKRCTSFFPVSRLTAIDGYATTEPSVQHRAQS